LLVGEPQCTFVDNVLNDGTFTGLAGAQTTPSAYCASLGNPSCEVLNVDPIVMDITNTWNAAFLIKMCHNGKFEAKPMVTLNAAGIIGDSVFDNGGNLKTSWVALDTATYLSAVAGTTTLPNGHTSLNLAGGCW